MVLYKGLVGKVIEKKKRSKLCSSNLKPRKTKADGIQHGEMLFRDPAYSLLLVKIMSNAIMSHDHLIWSTNVHVCGRQAWRAVPYSFSAGFIYQLALVDSFIFTSVLRILLRKLAFKEIFKCCRSGLWDRLWKDMGQVYSHK